MVEGGLATRWYERRVRRCTRSCVCHVTSRPLHLLAYNLLQDSWENPSRTCPNASANTNSKATHVPSVYRYIYINIFFLVSAFAFYCPMSQSSRLVCCRRWKFWGLGWSTIPFPFPSSSSSFPIQFLSLFEAYSHWLSFSFFIFCFNFPNQTSGKFRWESNDWRWPEPFPEFQRHFCVFGRRSCLHRCQCQRFFWLLISLLMNSHAFDFLISFLFTLY